MFAILNLYEWMELLFSFFILILSNKLSQALFSGNKISILIVDDHPSVRYGIKSVLEDEPFTDVIAEAESGDQALELMKEKTFDIVFMDIAMKGGDGFESTAFITQTYPSTKVIAISMHQEERYVYEMFNNGAKGYLLKNADRDIIILAMQEVYAGRTYVSSELSFVFDKDKVASNSIQARTGGHSERLREIIYLMCFEKTSKEIADIMCLSPRTVEQYRRHINQMIGSVSVVGVINYANENGIRQDILLKNKFENKLNKSKKKFE